MAVQLEPGSGRYWLQRLGKQLEAELPDLELLQRYRCGDHPLPDSHPRSKEAFRQLQRKARSNYTGLVVESVRERARPIGFRTGGKGTNTQDTEAWKVWQANSLDAECGIVHAQSLTFGRSYVLVGPPDESGYPVITAEDPRQVTHIPDPVRRRVVRAALKMWFDDETGMNHAVVYLANEIHYYVRPKDKTYRPMFNQAKWADDTNEGNPETPGMAANPLGVVPMVPFINRPDASPRGVGEFADVLDIQDRINAVVFDRLVTGKMQAFRQRWVKGIKFEDENGNPQQPFEPGADLLWAVEDSDAQFGDFAETDLKPFLEAAKADVNDLAAITRTPPHYLLGALVNLSGDALKAAETGLISKVKDRMVEWGESWEQVNRIAGMYTERVVPIDASLMWADPESRSMAELADAGLKKQTIGVPWRQLMEDLDYTPDQIARMRTERAADAMLTVATQPPVQAAPVTEEAPPNGGPPPNTG